MNPFLKLEGFLSFVQITYFQISFCTKTCGSKTVWCLRTKNSF